MLAAGFVDEAERIGADAVAADAVGYREASAYLNGWSTFQELQDAPNPQHTPLREAPSDVVSNRSRPRAHRGIGRRGGIPLRGGDVPRLDIADERLGRLAAVVR